MDFVRPHQRRDFMVAGVRQPVNAGRSQQGRQQLRARLGDVEVLVDAGAATNACRAIGTRRYPLPRLGASISRQRRKASAQAAIACSSVVLPVSLGPANTTCPGRANSTSPNLLKPRMRTDRIISTRNTTPKRRRTSPGIGIARLRTGLWRRAMTLPAATRLRRRSFVGAAGLGAASGQRRRSGARPGVNKTLPFRLHRFRDTLVSDDEEEDETVSLARPEGGYGNRVEPIR